jgi:hypothetical protein
MALAKGTNSYATVSEADSYFGDRLDVAAWTSASEQDKGKALVTATLILDGLDWMGVAVSETQALAFPRNVAYFDPRIGTEITVGGTTVPARVINGTYELAYHLLNNDGLLDDTGIVTDLQIGTISLKTIIAPSKIPFNVQRLIKPLLNNVAANAWWRAN